MAVVGEPLAVHCVGVRKGALTVVLTLRQVRSGGSQRHRDFIFLLNNQSAEPGIECKLLVHQPPDYDALNDGN